MGTYVYAFGCKRPPKEVRRQIQHQLWLAHRYRYALWQLAMAGRSAYRELRREHCPALVEAEAELERAAELHALAESKADKKAFLIPLQHARAKCRELRAAAKLDPAFAAEVEEQIRLQGVLKRALRKVFSRVLGLYSGTYLHVEAAAAAANAGTEDPVRPRWRGYDVDGEGVLAIQLQGGRTPPQIHSENPHVVLEKPQRKGKSRRMGSRTVAHYRIRSENGQTVQVPLDVHMCRDFPADAKITWAKLVVTHIHQFRFTYSLQFTVESELHAERRPRGHGVVAVCFAGDKIVCQDDYGEVLEVPCFTEPKKLRELQSIRDQRRNDAIGLLVGWCERQDETADWIRDEISAIKEHKACRRLYRLREQLRGVVPPELSKYLDEWAYRENHLYWWHNDLRQSALNRRKDAHRVFAAKLRARYDTVLLDDRKVDGKLLSVERRWLALNNFRNHVAHAFGPDHIVKMSGVSAEHMLEQWRGAKTADAARNLENPIEVEKMQKPKKAKRTGFARKHLEKKEAARKQASNVAE